MNDVALLKIASLQRCVARAREAYRSAGERFANDFTYQDAAILNVIRACDTAIELANMAIRQSHLGIPTESRESFTILEREGYLPSDLSKRLKAMVGFRNLAVHQYREIELAIVVHIVEFDLDDLLTFVEHLRQRL